MQEQSLSEVLKYLMFKENIRISELARRVGIPQQTLQRIVSGASTNPHDATLIPLADYFQLTPAELRGYQPPSTAEVQDDFPRFLALPLLSWHDEVFFSDEKRADFSHKKKIYTDLPLSAEAFALEICDSSMDPVYPAGTLLLVDPAIAVKDKHYVIVHLAGEPRAIIRMATTDGRDIYLKLLNPELVQGDLIKLKPEDRICGVVVQARRDLL